MQYLGYLLVLIHAALLLWASGGALELLLPNVPWKRFSNPDFPTYILIPHWSVVLYASIGFLYGYFTHWSKTPQFMLIGYSFMMLLCVIETFGNDQQDEVHRDGHRVRDLRGDPLPAVQEQVFHRVLQPVGIEAEERGRLPRSSFRCLAGRTFRYWTIMQSCTTRSPSA